MWELGMGLVWREGGTTYTLPGAAPWRSLGSFALEVSRAWGSFDTANHGYLLYLRLGQSRFQALALILLLVRRI